MSTASKESYGKVCDTCTPKKTAAITSCHGCDRHFCRRHFNEHRDQLSNHLNSRIDLHDQIRQDLQARIDRSLKEQRDNNDAKRLLQQIDDWVDRTITACLRVADKARNSIKLLFDKTKENDALAERLSIVARELEEQQESESFVERDLDRWMKQLEELKRDVYQPIEFPTDISIEIQNMDWKETIQICRTSSPDKTPKYYVLVTGDRGVGKTTFIHYVANYFANTHAYNDRLSQDIIELNTEEILVNLYNSEKTCMINQYSFTVDSQTTLVFLDCTNYNMDGIDEAINLTKSLLSVYKINRFAAMIVIVNGTGIKANPNLNKFNPNNEFASLEQSEKIFTLFGHVSLVRTNCPLHALNIDCSTLNTYDNFSVYFMQNSAYQLYRAPPIKVSPETTYCKSMETIQQIIDKIVQGIHRQE